MKPERDVVLIALLQTKKELLVDLSLQSECRPCRNAWLDDWIRQVEQPLDEMACAGETAHHRIAQPTI